MASGHVNRIKGPNTWLHRPMLQNVKKALANPEPMVWTPPSKQGEISSAKRNEGGCHASRSNRSGSCEVYVRGSWRRQPRKSRRAKDAASRCSRLLRQSAAMSGRHGSLERSASTCNRLPSSRPKAPVITPSIFGLRSTHKSHDIEKFSWSLGQEKGRRALRRRPCLATAGSWVRFRRIAFHVPTSTLTGSTQRRARPLHAGISNSYRGRLELCSRMESTIRWFRPTTNTARSVAGADVRYPRYRATSAAS